MLVLRAVEKPKLKINTVLIFLAVFGAFSPAHANQQKAWKKWREQKSLEFKERFAAPTITHHIYLKQPGDKAFLALGGDYPRFRSVDCSGCAYAFELMADRKVRMTYKKNKQEVTLDPKKETALPESPHLYVAAVDFPDSHRLFVYDLGQQDLEKRRNRQFFDYDPKQVFMATFRWLKAPRKAIIQRSDGSQKEMPVVAELELESLPEKSKLSIYNFSEDESYRQSENHMALYRDLSNGQQTYGAGRFLGLKFPKKIGRMKDGDKIEVDLNYSSNPPCAVSTGFHCPLPQDFINLVVLAGEKYQK